MQAVLDTLLMIAMPLLAIFLILLILVQRGRGGGLAGALGGMGGQSAFGTKAGDVFTKVTIVAATVWILICMLAVKQSKRDGESLVKGGTPPAPLSSGPTGGTTPGGSAETQQPAGGTTPAAPTTPSNPATPGNATPAEDATPPSNATPPSSTQPDDDK